MTELYIGVAAAIGGLLTQLVNWLLSRNKNNADIKGKNIDNEVKLSEYYKQLLDDLSIRYEKKYKEVVALYERKESILKDEILLLNRKVKMLKQENTELRKKNKEYEG